MAIESWTDLDYAQAAIDMLPGSVEEIRAFLIDQGIQNRYKGTSCPLQQWICKWTDGKPTVGWWTVSDGYRIDLPLPAQDYIEWIESL